MAKFGAVNHNGKSLDGFTGEDEGDACDWDNPSLIEALS